MVDKSMEVLKNWNSVWGSKPTAGHFRTIAKYRLARPGTKTAVALAMFLRHDGASQAQVQDALGASYLTRIDYLQKQGMIKLETQKINGHTFYHIIAVPKVKPWPRRRPHDEKEFEELMRGLVERVAQLEQRNTGV